MIKDVILKNNPWVLELSYRDVRACIDNINEEIADPRFEVDLPCKECAGQVDAIERCFLRYQGWFVGLLFVH